MKWFRRKPPTKEEMVAALEEHNRIFNNYNKAMANYYNTCQEENCADTIEKLTAYKIAEKEYEKFGNRYDKLKERYIKCLGATQ